MRTAQEKLEELELRKKDFIKEIDFFSVQHRKINKCLDIIKERALEINDRKEEIEVKDSLEVLETSYDQIIADSRIGKETEIVVLSNNIDKKESEVSKLKLEILSLESDKKLLENEKEFISNSILSKTDKLQELKNKSAKFSIIIEEIVEKERMKQTINSDILNLDNNRKVLILEIEKIKEKRDEIKALEVEQKVKFDIFKKTSDNIIKDFETGMDEKIKRLQEREGDASEKESILLKKEETLRNVKRELEIFYNRKFKNIII